MNIQKISNTGMSAIGQAIGSKMIRQCTNLDIAERFMKAIAKAYQDSGQNADEHDGDYLVSTMVDEVKNRHQNLRVDEIGIAIANGIRGDYDKYFGINVISLSRFLKCYMESEDRRKEMNVLKKLSEPAHVGPDMEEIARLENEVIIEAFRKFCEGGFYNDMGNHVYNKLDQRGHISFTSERKNKFMEEARVSLLSKNNPLNGKNLGERRDLQKQVTAILENTDDSKKSIIIEAKKIALSAFFNDHKDLETDFRALIQDGPIIEAF